MCQPPWQGSVAQALCVCRFFGPSYITYIRTYIRMAFVHGLCVLVSICRFSIMLSECSDFNGTQLVNEEQYKRLGIGEKRTNCYILFC